MRLTLMITAALIPLSAALAKPAPQSINVAQLAKVATVDERFQSYNVEMVEVTGGRFWAPYGGPPDEVYRQRPPADLTDKRLVQLARALGPVYMRVSGTWANTTYLPAEGEAVREPPAGYKQVLTRDQWRGVVGFAKAVDAHIVTSFAVGDGTRGPDGAWQSDQAQRLADLTRDAGGNITAAEFFNEPNAWFMGGLPADYNADAYTRDFRLFRVWALNNLPGMKIIGPGGVGEGALDGLPPVNGMARKMILTDDMMKANPGTVDAVTYHFYGNVSQRCKAIRTVTAQKDEALSPAWLDATLRDYNFYSKKRDTYEPGKPIWVTETAQAACGGSPWASTFLDSFRYLNQNGLLAQKGVAVIMHNTLAASDYALIDEYSMTPRPNYWAALLWRRTMGTRVLASPPSPAPDVRLYAHCAPGGKGAVSVLALNIGGGARTLPLAKRATAWLMTADQTDSGDIRINGEVPAMDADGRLSGLDGIAIKGALILPARSIAFMTIAGARNKACS